jgi:O-antigen/teichoic acid export membrane protein
LEKHQVIKINELTNRVKSFTNFFSDKSLTKKATLNALASGSDYFAQLVVGFITTSLMVTVLGDYFYGVWQIMNRLFSYVSTTAGATSPLTWILAKDQSSVDFDRKRSYVSSSIIVCLILLPLIIIGGGIIVWFAPRWFAAPPQYVGIVRIVAGLFIISEAFTALSYLPNAILKGENQGYRRLGLSIIVIFFNGGLVWLALLLKTGIIGVSIATILQLFVNGLFYFSVCKSYVPWFGIKKPSLDLVKKFLSLSAWFFAGDNIANYAAASDVVVLGLLNSVESVTAYTLTKYIPETIISIIAITVIGMLPGLGGIIGTGDLKKASQIREELFSFTWLIVTVIGTCILLWNRPFLTLWVGINRYAGTIPNLLIVIVVAQFVMIRTDSSIIDLTLRVQRKVLLGTISVVISIAMACILVGIFKMGIVGVCIGLLLGRLILSFSYPSIVSRFLGIKMSNQLKGILRPIITMILLFTSAFLVDLIMKPLALSRLSGWIFLILGVGITAILVLFLAFYAGLSINQRNNILARVKSMLSR